MMFIVVLLIMCSSIFLAHTTQVEAMRCELSIRNCNSYVILRKSPNTKSKALAKVPYGKTVLWVYSYDNGRAKNGFYKVYYGSKTGFIQTKYLGYVGKAKIVNCKKSVTMRKSPSSKSKVLKNIPKGAKISYEIKSKNGYCRIHYKGKLGYVLKKYVREYY